MNVIWKRPDGFHQALPSDYFAFEIGSNAKLWLHKTDKDNYPFRVSGGWQDEDLTKRLNRLVNLLPVALEEWHQTLAKLFHHSNKDTRMDFFEELFVWIVLLKSHLKGDTWEVSIMEETLDELLARLKQLRKTD